MKTIKQILLAIPAFLASLLFLVNPSYGSPWENHSISSISQLDITTNQINQNTHSIIDQSGCNCANCLQTNFQLFF
ncbi:hypothetical protein H6F32_18810 [Anabaena sp. FACHB-1237]|uniref:hypothetical protein n=1 Tax=Anabaena sp. FACHB-1237 TaxID=2692769 RepID=UPI0016805CDE|nr:hypothetical protein [Anabaena sp. FACHB-1237]MBD2139559.1 hypothetical protein [Anabaena sp. FACHB-1237]